MSHRDALGLFRNSHLRCSVKEGVSKKFANLTGTSLCWSLFSLKLQAQTCNFIKKRFQHQRFPVTFAKFLKTSILKNICEKLLLFVSPQNTIANSSGKFGLDETLTECKVFFLKHSNFIPGPQNKEGGSQGVCNTSRNFERQEFLFAKENCYII